ncbi:DUF6266 family protein [Pedobacter frigoris]|uniref:Uncharacterized protein n=1 Tax=Pedobacter frigoris TaxID=2571272 RepID=A0A4U1CQ96_9SPHI|nr:DUF6266 family protein [Pedobacter frigoris]TKC09496.1 hypothetical protein FA047_05225 [Pedobacter frigoris]
MARLKLGPWGGIVGALGNHVGYIRKGIAVLRMKSHPTNKKRTDKQKATTQRFQLIIKFIASMNNFTNVGFDVAARKVSPTAQNLAVSYNTKNAITGEYPNQEIDYPKVRVCEGTLPLATGIAVTAEDMGETVKLAFSWQTETDLPAASHRDQIMMLAYLPEIKESVYLDSGARRNEGQDFLMISKNYGAKRYPIVVTYAETYIAFVANDRNNISDSLYCGRIEF